jgi:hypothetical protein
MGIAFLQVVADDIEIAGPVMIIYKEIEKDAPWEEYKVAEQNPDDFCMPTRPVPGYRTYQTSPRVEKLIQNYQERVIQDPDELFSGSKTRLYVRN